MSEQADPPSLAVHGGPKAAADLTIPEWPQINDESLEYVTDCVESGAWCRLDSDANYVDRAESAFADLHDAEHAIAVSNGTVALELALRALGVQPGDEVIVPAYTFIATASAVACMGGVPKFADVDPETHNVDPESLREQVTEDTVGVIVVHFGGRPVDFDAVLDVTEEHDLFLVEDAAHAHGSEWRGEPIGTVGDVGTFSFQASKSVSSGEGGMVITDDDILAEDARLIHNIGREQDKPGYRHYVLSSNYRMSELEAALLCAQLEQFPEQFSLREANGERLREALGAIDGIETRPADDRVTARGYSTFSVNYDPDAFGGLPKDAFVEALSAEGVPVGGGYGHPLTTQPAMSREHLDALVPDDADVPRFRNQSLPGTEEVIDRRISFSHRYLLADSEDLELIPAAIEKVQVAARAGQLNGTTDD